MGGARLGHTFVDRWMIAIRLKFFLKTSLRIGGGGIAFFANRGERRLHQAQHNLPRLFPAHFREDRADDRFHRIGQNRGPLTALADFLAPAKNQMRAQIELQGQRLKMGPVHQSRAQDG